MRQFDWIERLRERANEEEGGTLELLWSEVLGLIDEIDKAKEHVNEVGRLMQEHDAQPREERRYVVTQRRGEDGPAGWVYEDLTEEEAVEEYRKRHEVYGDLVGVAKVCKLHITI